MPDESLLAIDFGTSNTVAVLARGDGAPEPLLVDGFPVLPSTVFNTRDGRLLVGRDAQRASASDPARCEPNPKRRIDDTSVLLGDREFAVPELIGAVLRRVWDEARRVNGTGVDRLVLTHPVNWGERRLGLLRAAADAAGVPVRPTLIPEPVAAAHRFAADSVERVGPGRFGLVYDLGAGTCDITLIRHRGTAFETGHTDGLPDVGGLDIDYALVALLRQWYPRGDIWRRLESPDTPADRRHRRLLWEDVRTTKELLSRESSASVFIPLLEVDTHLTRTELEDVARPLIRRTIDVATRVAAMADGGVQAIYLTGGASRMPLVATEMLRALGVPAIVAEQPELVIASGAVRAAVAPTHQPDAAAVPVPPIFEYDPTAYNTDPVPADFGITPEEIRNVQFSTVKLREGYDEEEVDAYLDEAEARVARGETPAVPGQTVVFKVTRLREGYAMNEVDDFVDRLIALSDAADARGSA
ncbi:MAG TPA: Hsp70 family protein [Stackebrandtia sp.]|uniref:Hsp70 family protein n=1 Tax=Stackebrandtia sp. TaxID=2023065 RepID=UPI002D239D18|nr:Hsp70 family protein [Stackebrandtia sp.]HZE40680.1 Hsp70 family protein [Stackebrandtia sp.]